MISAGTGTAATPATASGGADGWSMGASAGVAVINTVGQIWTGEINGAIQKEYYKMQGDIADISMGTAINALEVERQKMQAAVAGFRIKANAREKLTGSEAELTILRSERRQRAETRKATRIEAGFARRPHFYGHPQV